MGDFAGAGLTQTATESGKTGPAQANNRLDTNQGALPPDAVLNLHFFKGEFPMNEKRKLPDEKTADTAKKKTMDDFRHPSLSIGPTVEEFRIVSPGIHEPTGQITHE